ncbi:DUF1752-domain-containing protein [Mollisia scopiformis]|uniref:DUF1752-domain-containing protein n=1 Tax=Mollisia scopiformis TaxID=149040 RepID=A0A194WXA9_MOLSC|nr:DUF1752-domain-containing protein [Mollisia scopiformis]KUJ12314.1 DUF1752-domain-containing protein [Mollisia scopiformis]
MPSRLDAPVLTVDVGLIHKVDTRNVENLFSMWTVFSRCAGSLEEGRRLENLSWRLWNRETFCCDPVSEANATTPAISIASRSSEGRYSTTEVPSLSGSLDSLVDEEALEFESDNTSASTSAPLDISRPQILRQDSVHSRSRGRERHITPDDLEKMVITIKEKKNLEPLYLTPHFNLAPLPDRIPEPTAPPTIPEITTSSMESESTSENASEQSAQPASTDSASGASIKSTTSVVRGFSPSHVSSSYRSIPLLSAPSSIPTADLTDAPTSKGPQPKKGQMFALGGSSGEDSMSEQPNSIDSKLVPQQKKKNAMFSFGGSSNEDESSLPQKMSSRGALSEGQYLTKNKKQTSFREEVTTRTIKEEQPFDDDVFETDEDEIDESAIDDDDDSSDWEDSIEDSGNASIDEKTFFQRVDSRPNLTSRRSLITTMLHQNDRANALANAAAASKSTSALQRSRTSSPNGPSLAASPDSDDAAPLMMKKGLKPIAEVPRSAARPIIQTTTNITPHQQALSPRTTRRNMLASELTVSLRQHLLWERKQKSQTANAVLKRRHTAHDVANLKEYPDKPCLKDDSEPTKTWNEIFNNGLGEYHSRGW